MTAAITLVDPDAVRVARVGRASFEDDTGRIMATFEGEDGEFGPYEVQIVVKPEPFLVMITGVLDALGFPEADIEYLRGRYRREFA